MGELLAITPEVAIDQDELVITYFQSSGPGGQNINKVATAVRLRFSIVASKSLSEEVKHRLFHLAGKRVTAQGDLIIEARQHRTQELNRQTASARFIELVQLAADLPKTRHKTRPPKASKQHRLAEKKRRGELKRLRRSYPVE